MENIKEYIITHESFISFVNKNPNFISDFLKVKSLASLNKFIKSESEKINSIYKNVFKDDNKIKGDIFEIFGELFFKILGASPSIGVSNLSLIPPEEDFGVDAIGVNTKNENVAIQFKYRSNFDLLLEEKDIKQFPFQSIKKYNIDINKQNIILFTSTKGLHWNTDKNVFCNSIKTINFEIINKHINNNNCFWNSVQKYFDNSLEHYYF